MPAPPADALLSNPPDAPAAPSRFRAVLVRVLLTQAVALAGLALLQRTFTP